MNWKWVKHWSFFAVLILMIFLIWLYMQEPERNYTGLTEVKHPDIAITFDFSKNKRRYKKEQGYKVSYKYLTDRRQND